MGVSNIHPPGTSALARRDFKKVEEVVSGAKAGEDIGHSRRANTSLEFVDGSLRLHAAFLTGRPL